MSTIFCLHSTVMLYGFLTFTFDKWEISRSDFFGRFSISHSVFVTCFMVTTFIVKVPDTCVMMIMWLLCLSVVILELYKISKCECLKKQ